MKKIYLLFAMLLGFFTPVFAQDDAFDFDTKTIQITGAVASFQTNTWYFVYQGRGNGQAAGSYPLLTTGQTPGEQNDKGGLMTDMGEGEQVLKIDFNNVLGDGHAAADNAKYLVRFIPNEETAGTYYIQFGTGRYLSPPSKKENSATFTTYTSIYDAGTFFVYSIEAESVGHFALHVNDDHLGLFDNNGTGNGIVTWGTGPKTVADGNSVWSIHEVKWTTVNEYDMAMKALEDLYREYNSKYMTIDEGGSFPHATFPIGTAPGQYSAEAVAAFEAAMTAARIIDDPTVTITLEQALTLTENLKNAYEAVVASQIPFTLPDGYYRIRGALKYTNTVDVYNPETEQNEPKEMQVDKYMYSILENGNIYARWNTPEELATDCPSLWKITNKDGYYDVMNMATDARFNNIATSKDETMSKDTENLMAFDLVGYKEGLGCIVNIRVSTQAAGGYFYLHQGGHGGGTGISGNIVGWSTSYAAGNCGGSEWVFDLVSDADAKAIIDAYAPIKDHDVLVAQYKELKEDATTAVEIAKDVKTIKLITAANQFSSPYSQNDLGDTDGGNLSDGVLIDNDPNTFWHSYWGGGNVEPGTHYLQVALNEPTHELVTFSFARRCSGGSPHNNDYVTQWGIYGSNDPNAGKDSWTQLTTFETTANTQNVLTAIGEFDTQEMQYIRFYADATNSGNGFWHLGELQLYYLQDNPSSQYIQMGQVAVNLENLLKEQASIEDEDLDLATYQALLERYEAFMKVFVDPAELRAVVDSVKNIPDMIVVAEGEKVNPGYWADKSTGDALQAVIDAATAYDAAGKYTAAESDAYIAQLREKAAAIPAAAKGIETGKWYRIQFPSKEMFVQYGWGLVAGTGLDLDNKAITEDTDPSRIKTENLWDKFAAITEFEYDELGREVHEAPTGTVMLGHNVYFANEEDIEDPAMSQFRFVAVGDTAYVLQNRATGMFLKAAGTSGAVTLSVHPSLFNVRAIGYGLNAIAAKNLMGEAESYLHAQVSGNTLVTWNVSEPGTRSALFIEEVEDVKADYNPTTFNIGLRTGEMDAYCFATDITTSVKDIYGVTDVETTGEGIKITLVPINGAVNAGRPFILINGKDKTAQYNTEENPEPITFQHNYQFVATPAQTSALLKGTYYAQTVGTGVIVADGNKLAVTKKADVAVGGNSAYIALEDGEKFNLSASVSFIIEGEDGIATALSNVAKTGELYTIDGRLISRKANLSTLRTLGRGIYILNGTKVTVK